MVSSRLHQEGHLRRIIAWIRTLIMFKVTAILALLMDNLLRQTVALLSNNLYYVALMMDKLPNSITEYSLHRDFPLINWVQHHGNCLSTFGISPRSCHDVSLAPLENNVTLIKIIAKTTMFCYSYHGSFKQVGVKDRQNLSTIRNNPRSELLMWHQSNSN